MKRLITILLLAISGFASAQTYQLNYPDIRIGNSNTGKIVLRGSNVQFPFLALGSITDSVVTIDNGVFKKVPRSQFSGGGGGAVSSVFGRTGAVTSQSSDYDPFYPLLVGTYNNPTWINTLAYSKITGVPAFITTETDPVWSGVSANYRTKTQNDGLYYPLTGNPSGFLTSFTELDPTVPAYAKTLTAFSVIKPSTDVLYEPIITSGSAAQYIKGNKTLGTFQTDVSANTDVAANTAARHSAVTIGTANGLSLAGQVLSIGLSSSGVNGALSGSDWNTFNSKQNQLVLTTLGTSGTASLIGNTLNIPNYATGGGAGSSALRVPVTLASGATVIPITWATYSATYGVSPTDLSLIELSSTGDRQVFTNWYSDDNGVTYKFDVAPETGSRNFVVVISGGSMVSSGNVTSVTSANGDISVTNSSTTPVLTLNSGTGANQIVKRNGSGVIADLAPYALDVNVLHKTGNETATGIKTLQRIIVGSATTSEKIETDGYVKAVGFATLAGTSSDLLTADGGTTTSGNFLHTTGNESKTGNLDLDGFFTAKRIGIDVSSFSDALTVNGNSRFGISTAANVLVDVQGSTGNNKLISKRNWVEEGLEIDASTVRVKQISVGRDPLGIMGTFEGTITNGNNLDGVIVTTKTAATSNGYYDVFGISSQTTDQNIPSGVYDTGLRVAITGDAYSQANTFAGRLGTQIGLRGRAGFGGTTGGQTGAIVDNAIGVLAEIRNETPNVTIGNAYGIKIAGLASNAGSITNLYGLYQEDINAKNFFAGDVEGKSFKKTGGTSAQFLKADGSLDNNTYLSSAAIATGQTIGANTTGSAATLSTTRSIWGQNFNGASNVSGALSGATTINASGIITGSSFTGAGTGLTGTASSLVSGNATKLSTPRSIGTTGISSTPASFDGSANVNIAVTDVPGTIVSGNISGSATGTNLNQVLAAGNIFTRSSSGTTGSPVFEDIIRYGVDGSSVSKIRGVNSLSSNFGTGLSFQTNNPASANTNIESMRVMYGRTTFGSMRPLYIDNDVSAPSQINGIYYDTDNTGYSFGIGKVVSGTKTNQITLTDANVVQITGKATVSSAPTNPTDVVRLQDLPVSSSGTYVPTISNTTNVTSSSANQCFYTRQGNIVTVYGSASITPTSATNTRFHVSLPPSLPATDFISDADLSGIVSGDQFQYGFAIGSPSLDVADLRALFTSTTGAYRVTFNFQYIIK